MNIQRSKSLREKLAINHQKNFAKKVFQELSISFKLNEVLFGKERDDLLEILRINSRVLSVTSYNPTDEEIDTLTGDRIYIELGFKHKVDEILKLLSPLDNNPKAYLWFIHVESPIFVTGINDLISVIRNICQFSAFDFIISTQNFETGLWWLCRK